MNITNRQKLILKIVIDNYIQTASPVSSNQILQHFPLKISSATIRNEYVILTQKGYLEKVHESSGRVPSTKGYRFYVNELSTSNTSIKELEFLKHHLKTLFDKRDISISNILAKVSNIISEMMNVTTIVVDHSDMDANLKKISMIDIDNKKTVVIFILNNGQVYNKIFSIKNIKLSELKLVIELFNNRLKNTKISELEDRFSSLKEILSNELVGYELILKKFTEALINISHINQSTSGYKYMLQNPEFNNTKKIKDIINFIENISPFEYLQEINKKSKQKVNFKIGNEIKENELLDQDIAICSATYYINDLQTSLAFIGPKRMQYNKIYKILNWLSEQIRHKLAVEPKDMKLLMNTKVLQNQIQIQKKDITKNGSKFKK